MSESNNDISESFYKYIFALGMFVHGYAQIEILLKNAITVASDIPNDVARVVFGGQQTDRLVAMTRAVFKSKDQSIPLIMDRALKHLLDISLARNTIFHYGVSQAEGVLVSSKANWGIDKTVHKEFLISGEVLDDMCADLNLIHDAMVYGIVLAKSRDGVLDDESHPFQRGALIPWRYKPPQ